MTDTGGLLRQPEVFEARGVKGCMACAVVVPLIAIPLAVFVWISEPWTPEAWVFTVIALVTAPILSIVPRLFRNKAVVRIDAQGVLWAANGPEPIPFAAIMRCQVEEIGGRSSVRFDLHESERHRLKDGGRGGKLKNWAVGEGDIYINTGILNRSAAEINNAFADWWAWWHRHNPGRPTP